MTMCDSLSRSSRTGSLPVVLLLLGTAWLQPILGQAPCAPPQGMKARLQDKPDAGAYTDLGVWFADQKQYTCAADAFATSMQMQPDQKDLPHIAFMFGVSLYFSGDTKEAVTALQQAEQLGINDVKIHTILAAAFDATVQTKDAEDEWRATLAFDPESSVALDALSNDLLRDNDFTGTIALLQVPRLVGQRTPQQSLNLAAAYARIARLDDAAHVLRDSLNTSPDSLALVNQLAKTLVELKRGDEAVTVLEVALATHTQDADTAILYLGTLMAAQPDKAPEAAQRLLLTFPQNAKMLYLSGVVDMKAGNLQQARAHLEQSLSLEPDEALPHEALGVVLAELKEMTGAKEQFERAIALGDGSTEVKANLARVVAALGAGK
jgi:Flp pilus assembly protein TadD